MQRHFTATVFVYDQNDRVLLLWHKRMQKWMPPGGHIEPNELPEEAAKRECLEETGLVVEVLGEPVTDYFLENADEGKTLLKPFAVLLENIPASEERGEPAHQHIDFTFVARIKDSSPVIQEAEADEIRWFTKEELLNLPPKDIFTNVQKLAVDLVRRHSAGGH